MKDTVAAEARAAARRAIGAGALKVLKPPDDVQPPHMRDAADEVDAIAAARHAIGGPSWSPRMRIAADDDVKAIAAARRAIGGPRWSPHTRDAANDIDAIVDAIAAVRRAMGAPRKSPQAPPPPALVAMGAQRRTRSVLLEA